MLCLFNHCPMCHCLGLKLKLESSIPYPPVSITQKARSVDVSYSLPPYKSTMFAVLDFIDNLLSYYIYYGNGDDSGFQIDFFLFPIISI